VTLGELRTTVSLADMLTAIDALDALDAAKAEATKKR
jgi:hypothetical protein